MPIWLTLSIGLTGSIVGAVVGKAISNDNAYVISFLSFAVAIALVAAYRQVRSAAARVRAGCVRRSRSAASASSSSDRGCRSSASIPMSSDPTRRIVERARLEAMLQELHRAGLLDDDELAAKRAALDERSRSSSS